MPPSVRTLDQIMGELGTIYDPQVNSIRQRQSLIPEQIKQEEQGLQAKQENAFGDILGGARRRGLGFSGIPLGEQAKYTATEFLPALARLRQSGREQALSLEDAILGIQERRQNQALQLRQYEQSRLDAYESEQRQLAESRRQAAAAAASPSFGGGSPQGGSPQTAGAQSGAQMVQRQDKGFNFVINGKPVSAAQYAQATGISFRKLLQTMANDGDKGAANALNFVGDDYKFDPRRMNFDNAAIYNALTWGSGLGNASLQAPQKTLWNSISGQVAMPTWGYR